MYYWYLILFVKKFCFLCHPNNLDLVVTFKRNLAYSISHLFISNIYLSRIQCNSEDSEYYIEFSNKFICLHDSDISHWLIKDFEDIVVLLSLLHLEILYSERKKFNKLFCLSYKSKVIVNNIRCRDYFWYKTILVASFVSSRVLFINSNHIGIN